LEKSIYAIIGAGNGGQAFAAHLGLKGFPVQLYDIEKAKVDALKKFGKIKVTGALEGTASINMITNDIGEAVRGAKVVMVVLPTNYQASIAKAMSPHLVDGQIIILHPGATGGALEFRNAILTENPDRKVILAETVTLLYACRSPQAGEVIIYGIKDKVELATLPSSNVQQVLDEINQAFPEFSALPNILYTSLNNVNAMMHPAPTLLNAGRIECKSSFDYYSEGVTPALTKVIEKLDSERRAIGEALGIKLQRIEDWYRESYGVSGATLHELVQNVKAYEGIKGPTTLNTRYIFEDIPTGLVPLSLLGSVVGVKTPTINAIVEVGNIVLGRDFWKEGRTLEKLGLAGKTPEQIVDSIA
jgi:opine dehydrogenase